MATSIAQTPQSAASAKSAAGIQVAAKLPPLQTPITTPAPQLGMSGDESKEEANPFLMPPANEVFTLRERDRLKQREERAKERQLKVHEKMTYSTRMNAKLAGLRRQVLSPEVTSADRTLQKESNKLKETQFLLTTTKDRKLQKEDLDSYVGRKKEMFLVQYALGVKKDEIQKLEDIVRAEEKKLESAERYLEHNASMFDEFLKENDKNAIEAIKMAEAATKGKLEKVAEIKRLNAQLILTKNEISRNSDILHELQTYKDFLDSLAPQEWHERRRPSGVSQQSKSSSRKTGKSRLSSSTGTTTGKGSRKRGSSAGTKSEQRGGLMEEDTEDVFDDEVELYFTDPVQLIAIFTELEEQNLSLIQNSQETEMTLEEVKQNKQLTVEKMTRETENLKRQIELLQNAIAREEEKAYDLEIKSKLYSYGEYKADDQEQMLAELDKKVAFIYARCIGTNDANIPTLQMLAAIENRLEELFDTIETLPAEKIEAAEKAKEKERRIRQREEKLEEQRLAQEERLRRAQERAQADPKKRVGRKLVYRSEPPLRKRKQDDTDDKKEKEEEELLYFFT